MVLPAVTARIAAGAMSLRFGTVLEVTYWVMSAAWPAVRTCGRSVKSM